MALPGVRTILKDRFYSLSRADAPDLTTIVALARRESLDAWAQPDPGLGYDEGDQVEHGGDYYQSLEDGNESEPGVDDSWELLAPDYRPFNPRREEDVIKSFGEGSELHRAYLEATAGSASQLVMVPIPGNTTDTELASDAVLELAFDAAETAEPDIIVPWGRGWREDDDGTDVGFTADNSSVSADSLAVKVARRCRDITDRTRPCFAVMGVGPLVTDDEDPTSNELNDHLALDGLVDREDPQLVDAGPYVVVVTTEIAPVSRKDHYYEDYGFSNGAAMYAALLSTLPSEKASTGRQLFGVSRQRYNLTRPQQRDLIDQGVTPVALNFARASTVIDGLTFSPGASDYTRLTTLRIVFDASQLVRRIASRYVGMPATLHHRNALDTAITSGLRDMMIQGALINADHQITYIPRENKAQIDLVLLAAFELRNIEISISVQL